MEVSKHFGVPSAASFCKRQVPRIMYAVIETGGKQYQVKAVYTGMGRENKTWRDCTVRFESDNLWIQDKKKVDRRKLKVEDKPYV